MPNYVEALTKVVNQTTTDSGLAVLQETNKQTEKEIDAYTAQMQPIASTQFGQDALLKLVGDPTADKTQRAAAAQAVNPGLKARVGANGELSFSSSPGADLGFDYPGQTKKTTLQNTAGSSAKASDAVTNFNTSYSKIQGMTDPNEIANEYASLMASSTEFVNARRAQYMNEVGISLGLPGLEQQMQADKIADQEFYNTYYNGQNLGPTDESLNTIAAYRQVQTDTDKLVNEKLAQDPDVVALNTRIQALGTLVDTKTRSALSSAENAKAAKASVVPTEQVDAAFIALGQDPATATVDQRNAVALQIPTSPYYRAAANVGQMSPIDLATTAATDTGDAGQMATRVMKNQLKDNPDDYKAILTAYQNFDTNSLDKSQQEALRPDPLITDSKGRQAEQVRIAKQKMAFVLNKLQTDRETAFGSTVDQWATPQDPLLVDEFPKIVQDLKATDPSKPITIDAVVSKFNFTGADRQAKIEAITNYVNSQAKNLSNNSFFGAPPMYANTEMTRRWVQTILVRNDFNARQQRYTDTPSRYWQERL